MLGGGHRSPFAARTPAAAEVQSVIHDVARLSHNGVQVFLADQALRVNFQDILSSRRPRSKPPIGRNNLQPANRRIVSRSTGQPRDNGLTGEL